MYVFHIVDYCLYIKNINDVIVVHNFFDEIVRIKNIDVMNNK